MKTDKVLLMAIIGVVVAILGFVFLSGNTNAGGEGADGENPSVAGGMEDSDKGFSSLANNRRDEETMRLGGKVPAANLVEWTVPDGIDDWGDVSEYLTQKRGGEIQLQQWNAGITGKLAGRAIKISREMASKAALSGTGGAGRGEAARGDARKGTKNLASSGSGAKKVPPSSGGSSGARSKKTASVRVPGRSTPWADFLMKPEAAATKKAPPPAAASSAAGAGGIAAAKPVAGRSYKIRSGDNLWNISLAAYGRGSLFPEIVKANPKTIPNADVVLTEGKVILIPQLKR